MSDNVIEFKPGMLPAKPIRHSGVCRHKQVFVDQKTRMLQCQNCEAIIEPFDFMWNWAIRDQSLEMNRMYLKRDIERLLIELTELQRQERNIKARIRRVKNKV